MTGQVETVPLGDSAVLIRIRRIEGSYETAHSLAELVAGARLPGVRDAAAAYATVAVYFDPLLTSHDAVAGAASRLLEVTGERPSATAPLHRIPVVYDGADLADVAAQLGMARERVIDLHSSVEYTAHAVGFVPGFAYLGELDERLRLPRRASPRPRVPAGSVAIAGSHTAVYPFVTPGGWHLIGRTDAKLFDTGRSPPALLTVGARVRFEPQ